MPIHTRPVTLLTASNRIEFLVRGERFATYRYDDGVTPGFVVLYAQEERAITQPTANGLALWLAHGNVNGFAFGTGRSGKTVGRTLEQALEGTAETNINSMPDGAVTTESGTPGVSVAHGTIVSLEMLTRRSTYSVGFQHTCGWMAPDGRRIMTDIRTVRVTPGPSEGAILDVRIVLQAPTETSVLLGHTEDALLCIRAASALTSVDAFALGGGQLRNSLGVYGASEVHGRMAKWCACVGVVRGETVGFAFIEHPDNPFFPTPWVAHSDGVLSPSPFAWRTLNLAAGASLTLRYRLLIHVGYVNQGWADARQADYARENP